MTKFGKKYQDALKLIEADKFYAPKEAVELVKKTSVTKFDSTVEVAFKLGVNPKYADQQVRGALVLPHGTGKSKSVLVFAKGAKVQEAEAAGLLAQQHGRQVAMAQANGPLIRNGTGDAECLQANADGLGGICSCFAALLQRNGSAKGIGPDSVFKRDGLHALHDFFNINALIEADGARILKGSHAIFRQARVDFGHSSFLSFKLNHVVTSLSLYSSRGSIYFGASA